MGTDVGRARTGEQSGRQIPFRVQVGTEGLFDGAKLQVQPTRLVLIEERHHQRGFRTAFREDARLQSAHEVQRASDAARRIEREHAADEPRCRDRIDRLQRIADYATSDEFPASDALTRAFGSRPDTQVEAIEAARSEIEMVTGFHPDRVLGLRNVAAQESSVVEADTNDIIDVALAIQRHLSTDDVYASEASIVRAATRTLHESAGTWSQAYDSIENVWVAGLSTLSATMADFLAVVGRQIDVDVHLCLRSGTGPTIEERLPPLLDVTGPGREVIR